MYFVTLNSLAARLFPMEMRFVWLGLSWTWAWRLQKIDPLSLFSLIEISQCFVRRRGQLLFPSRLRQASVYYGKRHVFVGLRSTHYWSDSRDTLLCILLLGDKSQKSQEATIPYRVGCISLSLRSSRTANRVTAANIDNNTKNTRAFLTCIRDNLAVFDRPVIRASFLDGSIEKKI
ncbi:uncharacterized protein BDCG_01648 [Blastomyces dermatitidis ER-3]|uniref:Uncharacterized protein n=1 Tax=Ajellomyces dermatitidis (strain ER-3 / ATCC MYA-2586) TaxID=559297 RepID=A0ABP2EW09_AJEDR|nr:uncharacterized protein BDCG_01648 [Blastomyces dermatitidis ER-3]EEQ86528.2 hypothetical protein BDCG_01648 [Blastomyces dermatitidis ER-3]